MWAIRCWRTPRSNAVVLSYSHRICWRGISSRNVSSARSSARLGLGLEPRPGAHRNTGRPVVVRTPSRGSMRAEAREPCQTLRLPWASRGDSRRSRPQCRLLPFASRHRLVLEAPGCGGRETRLSPTARALAQNPARVRGLDLARPRLSPAASAPRLHPRARQQSCSRRDESSVASCSSNTNHRADEAPKAEYWPAASDALTALCGASQDLADFWQPAANCSATPPSTRTAPPRGIRAPVREARSWAVPC